MNEPTRFHPGFAVEDPSASAAFLERFFGFRRTVDRAEYVQLRCESLNAEIGFVLAGLGSSPAAFRPAFAGDGAWLTIEVDDVESALEAFVAEDYPRVESLADREFGERHFVVRAPGGILINVVERKRNR